MIDKHISVTLISPGVLNSPYYYAQWVLPGTTKRISRSLKTDSELEAERRRAELEYELNHGLHVEPINADWSQFREVYHSEHLASRRKNTQSAARTVLDRFEEDIRPRRAADVDERMLSQYFGGLRACGMKAATVAKHSAYLRAAMRWAHRQGFTHKCPEFETVKQPRKIRVKTIKPEQFERLLAGLPSQEWRLLAQLAWYTGLRRIELFQMRWNEGGDAEACWIDLENERFVIPAEACKADSDSWLPIHDELMPILLAIPEQQRKGKVLNLSVSAKEFSRNFAKHARRAGFDITLHDLRRSFGSRYAKVVPAQVLQRLMRHSSIATTLRYYVDLDDGLKEAIGRA